MATTAAGTPYVEASDLVAGYPAVSLSLANHIDGLDGGKVLQVVRATDVTDRSTASTSFVDATGMTVTITPTSATSSILLFSSFRGATNTNGYFRCQITTSDNVAVSGAEDQTGGFSSSANKDFPFVLMGYASPATTSAVTYKVRFKIASGTVGIMRNASITGQLFAIEVAA